MSKKLALILVALLVLSSVLTACSSDSVDQAKDYVEAVLKGDGETAQKVACDGYQDETKALAEGYAALAEAREAIQNLDLKYDIGKGNNQKEVIVTGSYDVVELNDQGKVIADSAQQYVLASSTIDKHDMNQNGNDQERVNTRIVLTMKKSGSDWCIAKLTGGYVTVPAEVPADGVSTDEAPTAEAPTAETPTAEATSTSK